MPLSLPDGNGAQLCPQNRDPFLSAASYSTVGRNYALPFWKTIYWKTIEKMALQPVSLNNKIIPFSATVKNLGIYFDSNMNWNTQISGRPLHYVIRVQIPAPERIFLRSITLSSYDDAEYLHGNIICTSYCVDFCNYGSHNRGEAVYRGTLFPVIRSRMSEWASLLHVKEQYEERLNKETPNNRTMLAVDKFPHTGSVLCQRKGTTGIPRTATANENHGRLLQQVLQSLKRSLRRTSLKLGLSDRSVRRMFKEPGGFTYRIQVVQRLTERDERARLQYCS
ncbi:hypothetical protein ANN_10409 [Periplaneta americana]|uniref:Uncharacterized protein n=1 Tax=Periplaneta americana TaxID=6978 RepID=A0ABQ8TNX2_PERAM|nr:hypothetical protein ANN_10409 [Periplaneta americana]